MKTTRAMLVVLTLSSLTVIDARPVAGETYRPPWCVEYMGGRNGATNCSFHSYEQCMMTATPGSGGICVRNPFYSWHGPGDQNPDTTSRGGERTRRR